MLLGFESAIFAFRMFNSSVVNRIKISHKIHKDIIRAMIFQLIDITEFNVDDLADYYKNVRAIEKKNRHTSNMPISEESI